MVTQDIESLREGCFMVEIQHVTSFFIFLGSNVSILYGFFDLDFSKIISNCSISFSELFIKFDNFNCLWMRDKVTRRRYVSLNEISLCERYINPYMYDANVSVIAASFFKL